MVAVRTIKIRSVVDAQYSKNYNRLEFNIDPDSWSTDLSESYLALRMYLAHDTGSTPTKYTKDELHELALSGVYVSFGQNGISYAPTCLVKLARLYAKNNQSMPLEEINFQNVLTETLHQICEDFESVGSSSLVSNSSVVFGAPQSLTSFFANLIPDSIGDSAQQLPIEVHIPLKKIFGFFENKNCYLDDEALGGLRLVFELEDQRKLLDAQVVTETVVCPPVAADGVSGLIETLSVNPYTSLTQQVNLGDEAGVGAQATMGYDGTLPLIPEGVPLPNDTNYGNIMNPAFFTIQGEQIDTVAYNPTNMVITLRGTGWTQQMLTDMWMVEGNYARVNISASPNTAGQLAYQRQRVMMASMSQINNVILSGGGIVEISLADPYAPAVDANWTWLIDRLDFFDVAAHGVNPPQHFGQHIIALSQQTSDVDYPTYLVNNQIVVSASIMNTIVASGLVAYDGVATYTSNGAQFKLNCQVKATTLVGEQDTNVFPIEPAFNVYVAPDQPNTRAIQSNMLQAVPVQGDKTTILAVTPLGEDFLLTFTDLGFANKNSLQPAVTVNGVIYKQGQAYDGDLIDVSYHFYITNFNNATNGYDGENGPIGCPPADYTYLIDKSELVLVQQTRPKGVPMSRMYFTTKVEVATIETQLPVYSRQFVVTEPNVYSILLCTPQYVATATQPECLASWHRGVSRYRWSVNNIDDTNRDLEVWTNNSHYPSSLHLEKLMDAMSNDGHTVKSLSGLLTVPQSHLPIVPFPLKIFDAMDTPLGFRMHPQGFVLQWTAYGDPIHDSPVQPGTIYLFKRLIRTF